MNPKEKHSHPVTDSTVPIAVAEINKATEISLCAVPISYEVRINDELICTLNQLENAYIVYGAILCDLKGAVFRG